MHKACPIVVEKIKWGFPNFEFQEQILCSMSAHKKHCSFGFWLGNEMQDPDNILQQIGKTAMGNLGQLKSIADLPNDEILVKYIHEAIKLAENVKQKPSPKSEAKPKKTVGMPEIPDYFLLELEQNPTAKANFEKFSNSCKKEYIVWLCDAKTEKTRIKRMGEAIEMIKEAKQRNWKYQTKEKD
jgi:uncharacterized protein YdeI (YjbR/CyaY-like superfamily)